MATIPQITDPTLDAVDRALEAEQDVTARPYLGMSQLGHDCQRLLWYSFRWATAPQFSAAALKRFEDGHRGEDLQAARLRKVDGIQLWTVDPETGRQFGVADLGGHLRGHVDGVVQGLLQAPKTPHVWEHKQVGEDKQAKLAKLKHEKGEKQATAEWDNVYYIQAQLYMHYLELDRHYLTVASPGGRQTISCRTEADPIAAKQAIAKARGIIDTKEPPERISQDPDYYQCRWCGHNSICHGRRLPLVNCRTCVHATPEPDGNGRWSCAYWQDDIPLEVQRTGCDQHRYIPALLANIAQVSDADSDANWVEYRIPQEELGLFTFRNGGTQDWVDSIPTLESRELWAASAVDDVARLLSDEFLQEIRQRFGGKIVHVEPTKDPAKEKEGETA